MRSEINSLRNRAKRAGASWTTVEQLAAQLKQQASEIRERPNAIRRDAWHMLVGADSGSSPFWRHGFAKNYGKRFFEGDHTCIPGYDEIAQQIATEYPEYDHDEGTSELFDFLFSPYDKLPSRVELLSEAVARIESGATPDDEPAAEFAELAF